VKSISPAQSKSILKRRDGGEGMRMRRCRVGERKREKAQERERGEGGGVIWRVAVRVKRKVDWRDNVCNPPAFKQTRRENHVTCEVFSRAPGKGTNVRVCIDVHVRDGNTAGPSSDWKARKSETRWKHKPRPRVLRLKSITEVRNSRKRRTARWIYGAQGWNNPVHTPRPRRALSMTPARADAPRAHLQRTL